MLKMSQHIPKNRLLADVISYYSYNLITEMQGVYHYSKKTLPIKY